MHNHYDNDVETLLERSIDENYPKTTNHENKIKTNRCPFNGTSRSWFRPVRNNRVRKVQEKSKFNNMLLPEGWIRVFHESGMFFYCHIATKVVTWSMPYEIHTEPYRYHRVPVRSIPCLSALSQRCDSVKDLEKVMNEKRNDLKRDSVDELSRKDGSNEIGELKEKISVGNLNHSTNIVENDVSIDEIDNRERKKNEESEQIKEEGEIESSDENGIDEIISSKEPVLPRQYQLNKHRHSKPKKIRSKTISASDLTTSNKRKQTIEDEIDNSNKRKHLKSDTVTNTNNISETMISEEIDLDSRLLEPEEFHRYCEKMFTFVNEMKFIPRAIFNRKKNHVANGGQLCPTRHQGDNDKQLQPFEQSQQSLASSVLETTVPMNCTMKIKIPNKNLTLEVAGRNFSCILNMYCQQAYCLTPLFKSSSSMSGIHDFEVVCEINHSTYGVGEGRTKKIAKQKAIVKTLEILIPGFSQKIKSETPIANDNSISTDNACVRAAGSSASLSTGGGSGGVVQDPTDDMYSLFDIMEITDPRVFSYTTKLNSITPYNLLTECMNRHCVSDSEIKCKIEKQNTHNVYKLVIGEKEVQTNCENKREGRQLAAQYMLAKLHPHIQSWGGILRLYGPGTKPVKRFDMQEMQSLLLEDRGGVKTNLISLLRKKMLDLNEEYQGSADKSKAKFRTSFQTIPIIIFHPDSTKATSSAHNQ